MSALKNKHNHTHTFLTHYVILRVYTVMHNWEKLLIIEPPHVISTSVDSDEPVQLPFKHRNSKQCSVSSSIFIEISSD